MQANLKSIFSKKYKVNFELDEVVYFLNLIEDLIEDDFDSFEMFEAEFLNAIEPFLEFFEISGEVKSRNYKTTI